MLATLTISMVRPAIEIELAGALATAVVAGVGRLADFTELSTVTVGAIFGSLMMVSTALNSGAFNLKASADVKKFGARIKPRTLDKNSANNLLAIITPNNDLCLYYSTDW